jgi:hypothetical protein
MMAYPHSTNNAPTGLGAGESPTPVPRGLAAVEMNGSALADLFQTVHVLEKRLERVMRPVAPQEGRNSAAVEDKHGSSALVVELEAQRRGLCELNSRLHLILSALEF